MGERETSLKEEDDTADISILEFGSNRTEESSTKLLYMQWNIQKLKSTVPTQIDQYAVILWEIPQSPQQTIIDTINIRRIHDSAILSLLS